MREREIMKRYMEEVQKTNKIRWQSANSHPRDTRKEASMVREAD